MAIQRLHYAYDLYFPLERMTGVLATIAQAGGDPAKHRTDLFFRGQTVTVPFTSWLGYRMIRLAPGGRVRLYAHLRFRPNSARFARLRSRGQPPVFVRLILSVGQRTVQFRFFAPSTQTSQLFVESASIRDWLFQLLENHGGEIGALDTGQDAFYLLPDLQTCISKPDPEDPGQRKRQAVDVDQLVAKLVRQKPQPAAPPTVPLPEQKDRGPGTSPNLREVDLRRMSLADAELRGVDLCRTNLTGANLRGADLSDAKLDFANLEGADLSEARLKRASLKHACLRGAHLREANLIQARLDHADLVDADLGDAILGDCVQGQAILTGARLRKARLAGAQLGWVDLSHLDLEEADLRGANLGEAKLMHANLRQAILREADLDDAWLEYCNLIGADLRHASLVLASLNHADLDGADLRFAKLHYGTDLSHASTHAANFQETRFGFGTIWPDDVAWDGGPSRFVEPPPGSVLWSGPTGYSGFEGFLVHLGFGPAQLTRADYVVLPNMQSPDKIDEENPCAYLEFDDFVEVMGDRMARLESHSWRVPPGVELQDLGPWVDALWPYPGEDGTYSLTGVSREELGPVADSLEEAAGAYFSPGINLHDAEDHELYERLLARQLEASAFPTVDQAQCVEAARQMHIWFG